MPFAGQLKARVMEKKFEKVKERGNAKGYLQKRRAKAFKKGLDV